MSLTLSSQTIIHLFRRRLPFKTTAGGRVRFNPNLYNNGKVCLSLLGTWSGEPWKPSSSTILQVLVSLQSLVLVAEPYYNEPGYSKGLGTDKQSRNYNHDVFSNNLKYAILEQLRSPPDGLQMLSNLIFITRENG